MKVLVLNSGSSSIKYALFDIQTQTALVQGVLERIGEKQSVHQYHIELENTQTLHVPIENHQQGLTAIFLLLVELALLKNTSDLLCIGHRVVHGGEKFCQTIVEI